MRIKILDIPIDPLTRQEARERVTLFLNSGGPKQIVTVNPEMVMWAQQDFKFAKILLFKSALNLADGAGLLWAAKYLSTRRKGEVFSLLFSLSTLIWWPGYCRSIIPERVTGTDFMMDILDLAAEGSEKVKVFLLGGWNDSAKEVAGKLSRIYADLIFISHPGLPVSKEGQYDRQENEKIVAQVNQSGAEILLVAYGHPKQEFWINDNLKKFENIKIAMGVGGAFDFLSGRLMRAPVVLRRLNLEWLWRLVRQPWRLARVMTATYRFVSLVYRFGNK